MAEIELGASVTRISSDLAAITKSEGILPSPQVRFCTREAKIRPMEKWLSERGGAIVYYGLRADEEWRQGYNDNRDISAAYPLREHGIDIWGVWNILDHKGLLPPPFLFPELEQAVREKMGDDILVAQKLRPWHYNQLFSGRSRQFNCFDCFYMRRYEWAYMFLHWPDQFWEAVEIERSIGAEGYTLIKDYPLSRFAETYQEVIERRAEQVARVLYKLAQMNIFEEMPEELSMTSCGMFCGK